MSLFFHSYNPDDVAEDLFATFGINLEKWKEKISAINNDYDKYRKACALNKTSGENILTICRKIFELTKTICNAALPIPSEKLIDNDSKSLEGLFNFLMMDTLIHQGRYSNREKCKSFKQEYIDTNGSSSDYSNIKKAYKLFTSSNIYKEFFYYHIEETTAPTQHLVSNDNSYISTKYIDNESFNYPASEKNTIFMLAKYIKFNPFADYYSKVRPYKTLIKYFNDLYGSVNSSCFCSASYTELNKMIAQPTDKASEIAFVFTSYYLDQLFDSENLSYLTVELFEKPQDRKAAKNYTADMRVNAAKVLSLSYMIQNPFSKKAYIDKMISSVMSDFSTTNSYFNGNLYKQILATVGPGSEPSTMTSNLMFCRRYIMYLSTTYLPVLSACFYVLASHILGNSILEDLSKSDFFPTLSRYYQNRWKDAEDKQNCSFLYMQKDPWSYSDMFQKLFSIIKEQFYGKDKYSNLKKMVSISLKDKDYLRLYLSNTMIWQSININGLEVSELMNSTYAFDNSPENYGNLFGYVKLY